MKEAFIIEKAVDEIQNRTFGVTKQLLAVHEVVLIDGKPRPLRIDTEKQDGSAVAYFAIKDERFYLAVYLATVPNVAVTWVDTEDYNSVYFRATSEILNFGELVSLTTLPITEGWSKGDQRKSGKSFYNFSAVHFEPNPEPDEFEDKLRKLLDCLEQDVKGVQQLVEKANGYIQVHCVFHNGNTMLGGHHLDNHAIRRLSALNLAIDFDLYAEGKFFED